MADQTPNGTNGHTPSPEVMDAVRAVLGEMRADTTGLTDYVLVVTRDEKNFRGALTANSLTDPYIELHGAQIAQFVEGTTQPRWVTLDWPIIIFRENVSYLQRRP